MFSSHFVVAVAPFALFCIFFIYLLKREETKTDEYEQTQIKWKSYERKQNVLFNFSVNG